MKETVYRCDIEDMKHKGMVKPFNLDVIFDHDQEDGKSKCDPYFERLDIDLCDSCSDYILKNKRYIYAYGVMGNNNYYLKNQP